MKETGGYFRDKAALLTGASSGIGQELAWQLGQSGAKLTFTTGVFKGLLRGRYYLATPGNTPAFAMTEIKESFTSEYCTKEK